MATLTTLKTSGMNLARILQESIDSGDSGDSGDSDDCDDSLQLCFNYTLSNLVTNDSGNSGDSDYSDD